MIIETIAEAMEILIDPFCGEDSALTALEFVLENGTDEEIAEGRELYLERQA